MPTTSAKAGKYELLVDHFEQTNPDGSTTTYGKGDIVTLSAEDADRLTATSPRPAVAEPGSLQRAEAERLQALADAARADAEAAQARAAEFGDEAKASTKPR